MKNLLRVLNLKVGVLFNSYSINHLLKSNVKICFCLKFLLPFLLFQLHLSKSVGQIDSSYFQVASRYFSEHQYGSDDTVYRGAVYKENSRLFRTWGPRLYPHGDCRIASSAIVDYTLNFIQSAPCPPPSTVSSAEINALGPIGMPINNGGPNSGNGQIHRITFDPNYDGITNKTIYACSMFGGLVKSTNDGINWSLLNTDQLPIASVSDIAVDYANTNTIYISTGNGDQLTSFYSGPLWSISNPVYTCGIYKSINGGQTWQSIDNVNFLSNFNNGGTTRRLIINPTNSDEFYVATSEGIFKCNNATSASPQIVLSSNGLDMTDKEYRGLEFMPGNPSTLYCSGKDIYKSTNSGANWISITGPQTGLEINSIPDFQIWRINIAVTQADPDRIYAYLIGSSVSTPSKRYAYIYMFNNGTWTQLFTRNNWDFTYNRVDPFNEIYPTWMAIAASPVNADQVVFGNTLVWGNRDINLGVWAEEAHYASSAGFHADVHALVFQPNVATPNLFCGNHGGVSVKDMSIAPGNGWAARNDGLEFSLLWGFDQNPKDKSINVLSLQDCGLFYSTSLDPSGLPNWIRSKGGDGYGSKIFNPIENSAFTSFNGYVGLDKLTPNFIRIDQYPKGNQQNGWIDDARPWEPLWPGVHKLFNVKTFPIKTNFYTGRRILGLSELYERTIDEPTSYSNPNTYTLVQSDLSNTINGNWARQIIDFDICKYDENYCFVVVGGEENSAGIVVEPKLFRSISGLTNGTLSGNKFLDITSKLPATTYGSTQTNVITGVVCDPLNGNRVWISFSGYDANNKVYFSGDGGTTNFVNADPNASLPNLPVNCIALQEGTNDRLYIGTDAGIYTKNSFTNCWYKIDGIPNVRVTELKINYCSGKLVAATFGRGLWEIDLLENTTFEKSIEINSNTLWSSEKVIESNVTIKNGNTLTISNTIYMASGTSIYIEPNGKLIIDGGKLTNNCGEFWQGIQVYGSRFDHQYPINGQYLQGMVKIINRGTIENAREAISLWKAYDYSSTGGIVIADNAVFKNNRRSIAFMSYHNHHPYYPSIKTSNLSQITNSEFVIDDNFPGVDEFFAHITLWDVEGIRLLGNTFKNLKTLVNNSSTNNKGIFSIDAGYTLAPYCSSTVVPCPNTSLVKNSFEGFGWAIHATGSSLSTNSIRIDMADFDKNTIAVEVSKVNNQTITRSDFHIGNSIITGANNQKGLILTNSTGYRIEENSFIQATPSIASFTSGIETRNSGDQNNVIYKNNFNGLSTGNLSIGKNRGIVGFPYAGLQYLCNSNSNILQYDFDIEEDPFIPPGVSGVNYFQGSYYPNPPAGNNYSNLGNNAESDFKNATVNPLVVFYQSGGSEPLFFTGGNMVIPTFNTVSNTCPSNFTNYPIPHLGSNSSALESERISLWNDYTALLYSYEQLIDGGNSSQIVQMVQATWPAEAIAMRDDLLALSPYLSEDVLREAINTNILPSAIVLELCLANVASTRNDEFIRYLTEEAPTPLSLAMANIIIDNWETVSLRDLLESNISKAKSDYTFITNYQLSYIFNQDTLCSDSIANLIYHTRGDLEDAYSIISQALFNNNFSGAISMLDSIRNVVEGSDLDIIEIDEFVGFIDLLKSINERGLNFSNLGSADIDLLIYFRDNSFPRMREVANNILCFFYNNCETIDYELSGIGSSRLIRKNTAGSISSNGIEVSPNPGADFVNVKWQLNIVNAAMVLKIFDINGKCIHIDNIDNSHGNVVVDTHLFNDGLYFATIEINEAVYCKSKFNIVH